MAAMGRELYPNLKTVVSTWCFDKPVINGSEYAGMGALHTKMMSYVLNMMNYVLKMMNSVLKMIIYVLNRRIHQG